jgi:hypothetical protein
MLAWRILWREIGVTDYQYLLVAGRMRMGKVGRGYMSLLSVVRLKEEGSLFMRSNQSFDKALSTKVYLGAAEHCV